MKEHPQPKELSPNSLLGKLIEQSIERFQSTEIDQKHSEEFGYQYPYLLAEAVSDTIETYLITSAKPAYVVTGLICSDSYITPREVVPDLDEMEEDWKNTFLEIAVDIIDQEISARYPHLEEEDRRRRTIAAGI